MKTIGKLTLLSGLLFTTLATHAATTIINDTFNITTSGTGFALGSGANTGINPPTTRLTGSMASGLRYYQTSTARPASAYDIGNNRLRVQTGNNVGRFTISANSSSPYDFGSSLGVGAASPGQPVVYDIKISMRNDATSTARLTFGFGTVEGDVNNLDFGIQIYLANSGHTYYTVQKRIDRGSFNGTTTSDGTGDVNAVMTTTGSGTAATMINFLIRVTDAGAESGSSYNSRIQVSMDNGSTWVYDTDSDSAVSNRFRFDGAGRYASFDQAPNTSGNVFYDSFSMEWISGPRAWIGGGANGNWNNTANWGGAVPASGDKLIFSGTTRQTNTNDLSGLNVPWLSFNNGGFALYGNALTLSSSITNSAGNNSLNAPVTLGGALKLQSVAGTLTLGGNVTGGSQNLTVDGAGNTTVGGAISGTGCLTKNGSGTLQLSGASANTLSGNTVVNVGTLSLAKSAGNAIAGNLTVGDGTGGAGADVVQLAAGNQIADSAAVTISASGLFDLNGFSETVASVSGASSSSQIDLGAGTLTVGNGSAITFAGTISGTGNIVKQGAATMTLSGANTFSGTATINAGALNVQNASALGGAGATVVNSGTALEVQGGISIASEPLTLNGSGISSAGALRNVSGNNFWGGAVTLGSAARINSDSGTLTISGAMGGGQNLSVGGAGNTTVSGVISGAGSLAKDGGGTLQLSGDSANTYSGGTTVNVGTLSLAKTAGVAAIPGNLTIGDGSGADVVQLGAANQISDSATVTISTSGTLDLNGFAETVAVISSASGSQISLGAGTLTLGDSGSTTLAGSISGSGNFVKQGSGTATLSGANSFSGTATISAGVLNVQNASALGGAGATVVSSGTALEIQGGIAVSGEPLTLNGSGIGSAGALRNINGDNSWSGAVTLGSATRIHSDSGTLTISGGVGGGQNLTVAGAGNTTVSGVIASGSVTKESSGTLTLNGANTFSGNTTISAGTLALGSGGSIANSPSITIANGATLDVSATSFSVGASQTLVRNAASGNGSVNGSLTLSSGASVSLQANGSGTVGTLSVAGNLTLNGNTISINITGSALGASTNTLMTYTGSKSGSFNSTPTITGSGLVAGMLAEIVESAGQISLRVYYNPTRTWSGGGANNNWNAGANWDGAVPSNGDTLIFNGTTRQTSTNDISGLTVPSVTFNNGGFSLFGSAVTLINSITNGAGNNTLNGGLIWGAGVPHTWNVASGSELILNNTTTIETNGDHTIIGGGTLRVKGVMSLGQASTVNPPIIINEGKLVVDGGTLASRGGYRIGSSSSGSGAQTILTNGASFALTVSGANLRVGDSSNANASRLLMNNSTLTMSGGMLCIPFAANATGEVVQDGGTVSGALVCFSDSGAGTGSYTINGGGVLETIQIREDFSAGNSSIYFNNATLRTASGANSTFMTGIDTAQIQSGGLTIDATANVTIGQALSGTGALSKTGGSTITLTSANTYSGNTTINGGTLALGSGGSIANSPTITLANGTTLNVSAISFSLGASQTLARNSTSGSGNVNGSVTLNSGAKISLQANGTGGTVGAISVTGGLTLNANVISVNVTGNALGEGIYSLISYTGSKSGSFNTIATITGSGIASGKASRIVETAGQISLEVYTPGIPAHGIAAASIKVVQHDLANTTNSVTATTTFSINGLQMRDGSNRGDINVQIGSSSSDDVSGGVLISSIAENGRDHGEDSGINYCTSAMFSNAGGYVIPTANAPAGKEYNINVSAAYFPYATWLGGYAKNSSGTAGGANNQLIGSSSLVLGTHFVDNGSGTSTVNLTSLGIHSQTDGVLLVAGGGNNNHYAVSKANGNGTWTIFANDNSTDASAYEQNPVAFAFIPKTNVSVISGKFAGNETILMHDGPSPRFSVTELSTGTWRLSIPGYSPSKGVLVVSGEGGSGANANNTVSFQPSGNNWLIQSRALPGLGLQSLTNPPQPVASFVFIPAPTATLVSPANNANVSSSPTLTVSVTNNNPGNMTVTFHGHRLPVPGPGNDFMIPVLPDTQNYAREESGIGQATLAMWTAQTDWIVQNRISQNIPYVATLGDCVHNATAHWQWRNATNAMYRLEKQSTTLLVDGIPYGVTVGNHDQDTHGDPDSPTTYYNQYFGTAHFQNKAYYGGHFSTNNDNWYQLFDAGNLEFIVFSFEFGRYGSTVLNWAQNIINQHPDRRIIVLTHHAGSDNHPSSLSNQGSAIYDALKGNANFFLMLGGHVFSGSGHGEGHRTNTFNGNKVYTLISNYQNRNNGGNGLMRLMYFSPSNNLITIKTYSPHTGNFETDFNSQFTLPYNMKPNGNGVAGTAYAALKTNVNVVPGSQTSFAWTGLTANRPYEWHVTVEAENGDYATSVEWKFNTTASYSRPASDDENNNGLPDSWESTYGVSDPDADDDGDGQSNYAEFIANTNPTNAASLFKILDAKYDVNGQFNLKWSSVGGTRYRIQYSDEVEGEFVDLRRENYEEIDVSSFGQESIQSFTDPVVPENSTRFYRIRVVPQ